MQPLALLALVRSPRRLAACASFALIGACDSSIIVHESLPPPPPPPPPVWSECEPNDEPWLACWFGALFPGESIFVAGFSTDDGSDPQDGLAFTGLGPCRIDFTLFVDDPWADLDVWLYDPDLDEYVVGFTAPYGDESGTFWVDGTKDFHLVIVPSAGASTWTLRASASGPWYGDESAPTPVSSDAAASLRVLPNRDPADALEGEDRARGLTPPS
jgi:hypothetical protein